MKELIVGKNDSGQRLDRFISKSVPLLPDALLQKYIRLKRIKLNTKGAKRDTRLCEGDVLQLYLNDEFFEMPSEKNAWLKVSVPKLDIVYEDENILLINKPVGLLCHSDGQWSANTLVAQVQAYGNAEGFWSPQEENSFSPALCNRIDRNTGGIVIAAKNAVALRLMNEKLRNRELDKLYLCAVFGTPRPAEKRLEGYIFKDSVKNRVYVSEKSIPGSKSAVMQYRTLAKKDGLSLLECRLLTGRTHQIRAQLAHAGHPLLGDGKYGSERSNKEFGEKHQALWSYKLIFNFSTDAGVLNYLDGRSFSVKSVDFAEKYFDFDIMH